MAGTLTGLWTGDGGGGRVGDGGMGGREEVGIFSKK